MLSFVFLFFFNDTATTEIYTLSLHDALPISVADGNGLLRIARRQPQDLVALVAVRVEIPIVDTDRKSTRLNSSHVEISYAVFCLKKKKKKQKRNMQSCKEYSK